MHRWELVVSLQICRALWSHSLQKMVIVNLSGNGPGVIVSLPNLVLFHTLPRLYSLWRMTLLLAPCHFLVSFRLQFISSSKEGLNQPWRSSLWSTSLRLSFSNKYLQRERHSLDWDEQRPLFSIWEKYQHPLLLSMIWVSGRLRIFNYTRTHCLSFSHVICNESPIVESCVKSLVRGVRFIRSSFHWWS